MKLVNGFKDFALYLRVHGAIMQGKLTPSVLWTFLAHEHISMTVGRRFANKQTLPAIDLFIAFEGDPVLVEALKSDNLSF
jgi:hypothetical protein